MYEYIYFGGSTQITHITKISCIKFQTADPETCSI